MSKKIEEDHSCGPLIQWVLLVVIFTSQKSMAKDECSPIRLDETSMKAMPIYSQNDIGDCYAVATSQRN